MSVITAPGTRTAPKLVWKKVPGATRYEATFNGKRYRLEKSGPGLYFMSVFSPENAEHNKRARKDVTMRLKFEWDIVKPHPRLFDFGSTLAKAKANARLWLIEGRGGDDPQWQD